MSRALAELPAPVSGDTLRARMAALHGREDELLESGRFARLLRQANDAEVADVRKVGEDSYEITPHRSHTPSGIAEPSRTPARGAPEAADDNGSAPPLDRAAAPARSAALRFRRGSRSMLRPSELPLVGVVHVDEPATAEPAAAKEAKPRRAAARKATEPAKPRRPRKKSE